MYKPASRPFASAFGATLAATLMMVATIVPEAVMAKKALAGAIVADARA